MFLFYFYTGGMSFIDMAYLKKDLQNGIRFPTADERRGSSCSSNGKGVCRKLLTNIVNGTEYLLPIITKRNEDCQKQYTNELHRVNHLLKKIGKNLNLLIPLTMYVGRHSWASS